MQMPTAWFLSAVDAVRLACLVVEPTILSGRRNECSEEDRSRIFIFLLRTSSESRRKDLLTVIMK